jgi:hypothetical protein
LPENKTNRLTTINGEKTNGRTKKVGTVNPPEKLLIEYIYSAAVLIPLSTANYSLTQGEIELATRPGNIAIS